MGKRKRENKEEYLRRKIKRYEDKLRCEREKRKYFTRLPSLVFLLIRILCYLSEITRDVILIVKTCIS